MHHIGFTKKELHCRPEPENNTPERTTGPAFVNNWRAANYQTITSFVAGELRSARGQHGRGVPVRSKRLKPLYGGEQLAPEVRRPKAIGDKNYSHSTVMLPFKDCSSQEECAAPRQTAKLWFQ
jgi:hypothetical protein